MKSRVSPTGSYLFRVQKKRHLGVDELLLATPHSNLGQPLCACLVGWYPPSGGVRKQLLLGTRHLGGQGGGASKELEYEP